ncbi:MAG: conjugal transfer protein TraH [Rhizobacter sp.]
MTSTYTVQASITSEMTGLMDEMVSLPGDVAKGLADVPGDLKGSLMASGPSAIHGQTYGTYMGGRAFARFPVRNLQLGNVQMPHFSAGCGGIDMTFGSLSVLKGDKIVDFLKATAMSAVGVITQVALGAITPLLASKLEWAKDVVDKINGFNLNSCEVAQHAVAGGMNTMGIQSDCINNNMVYEGMDRDEAREGCMESAKMDASLKKAPAEAQPFYGNIVWELLKKTIGTASGTKDERELIMSMIGTNIYDKDGPAPGGSSVPEKTSTASTPRAFAPKLTDIAHLLYGNGPGGQTDAKTIPLVIFDCGTDDACLNPKEKTIKQGSFSAKVAKDLQGIADKIRHHDKLGADEELIINQTSMPVYQMMSLGTQVQGSFLAEQMIDTYKDVIAADYAYAMLARNIQAGMSAMTQKIKMTTPQADELKDLMQAAVHLRQDLRAQHSDAQRKVADMSATATVMQNLERAMTTSMPERVLALTSPGGPGGTGNK